MEDSGLVSELTDRWAPRLAPLPWSERLDLLADIHEQLFEDIGDINRYADISPHFIAGLVERWGRPSVLCEEQAQIYANSADEGHRTASGNWLQNRMAGSKAAATARRQVPPTTIDRRRAPRIVVDRPVTVVASGRPLGCRLVDISTGGAGIEMTEALSVGARIEIALPDNGKAAGKVVRAVPPTFGLAFVTPLSPETVAALQ